MHIWIDLLSREGALLAILLALGAGPAAFLSDRFPAAARVAIAPALGFCLGTCVTTTLLEFVPAGKTYWLLILLCLVSLGVAAVRMLHAGRRTHLALRDLLQLGVVCLAVAGPPTYLLHKHHTVGPVAYYFTDVDNFVAQQDAAQTTSIQTARAAWTQHLASGTQIRDLTQYQWAFLAHFDANLDATPLDANVNALLGLGATETFSPFLIVLLLMGGLGAFAAIRYVTQEPTWMASLAGALTGGAMFLELWFDSYQAAITAVGLVIPLALIAAETVRSPRRANVLLLALVAGAFLSVYSLFIPIFVITSALVLGWLAWAAHRRGNPLRPRIWTVTKIVAALVISAIAFNVVGFTRDVHYYKAVLNNQVPLPRVSYHLPLDVIPGWVLQTRELWNLTSLSAGGGKQLLLGAVVPLALVILVVVGVVRYRQALALVALAAVCGLVAEYAFASRESCTYCAERDLLPLGPILVVLVPLGLAALLAMRQGWARVLGIAGVVLVVVTVGQRAMVELTRFDHSSYFMDSANRSMLARVPPQTRTVHLEGYGESENAQAEQPLVYHLASERLPGHVSLGLGSNLYNGTEYLDFNNIESPGVAFKPSYEYVLTRLPGIATDRIVVARSGGIALEKRTHALDVVTYAGIQSPLVRLDAQGTAWVQPGQPLKLYLVGPATHPTFVRLTFMTHAPVTVPAQPGVTARARGSNLTVCVAALGSMLVRDASVVLTAPLVPAPIPREELPPPIPPQSIELVAMHAVSGVCLP